MMPKVLPREDPDAAKVVSDSIAADGVEFVTNVKFTRVEFDAATDGGLPVLRVIAEHEGVEKTFASEVLLVATGRRANTEVRGQNLNRLEGIHTVSLHAHHTHRLTTRSLYVPSHYTLTIRTYHYAHYTHIRFTLTIRIVSRHHSPYACLAIPTTG
jgi:hypothetical protein